VSPGVQRGTQHGLHEQLAVLIRQTAKVSQETRRAQGAYFVPGPQMLAED
jgi:hypothetical protein